jgi:CHAT domain-containing protein/Tfp pilus assembly protein PilF
MRCRTICFALLLATFVTMTEYTWAQLQPGSVIEEIAKNSEGERAGLQQGDILLSWSRNGLKGEIESPFDLSAIEIEQEPRGNVTLEGLRGAEKQAWRMGSDDWGIKARPNLPDNLLSIYREGRELAAEGKPVEAVQRLQTAARQAASIQDQALSSWLACWFQLRAAEILAEKNQWKDADAAYQQVVQQANSDGPAQAERFLRLWAESFFKRHDWDNSEKYFLQSLTEARKLGTEDMTMAAILGRLGILANFHSHVTKAEDYRRQALAIQEKLAPDSLPVSISFNSLGVYAMDRGDPAQAEEYLRKSLAIKQKLAPNSRIVASSLSNLGIVLRERGDLAAAEECERQALVVINRLAPNSLLVANILVNLGGFSLDRGDLAQAEEYTRRAVAIWEKLDPEGNGMIEALANLGSIALDRGDAAKAEEYLEQDLAIQKKLAPDAIERVSTLDNLGLVAQSRADLAKAEVYFQKALAIQEKYAPNSSEAAETLGLLGDLYRERDDLSNAEEYYRRALALREKLSPNSWAQAKWLAGLASIMRQKKQPEEAARLFEQALDVFEKQTAHLGGEEESHSNFRARHANYYSDYIDLLMEEKQVALAFQVLERSRAQTLLEMLTTARVDVRKGVAADLLQQERSLRELLSAKTDRRVHLLSDEHDDELLAVLNKEINELLTQYQDIEGQIRISSPSYAALTQPQPLSVSEIQQQLLDADTLLLEYSLGEKRSYVFALTPNSLNAYELPGRAEIESSARGVYQLLKTWHIPGLKVESREAPHKVVPRARELKLAAARLSEMVLAPVASQLRRKRLLIVGEGALQYIPFALLPIPSVSSATTAGQTQNQLPLIVEHEVVILPSASVLGVLRQEAAARKAPAKAVAVLADPVFDKDDDRIGVQNRSLKSTQLSRSGSGVIESGSVLNLQGGDSSPFSEGLSRSLTDVVTQGNERPYLSRLPFTRREAQAILAVTPAGEGMKALDFDASRATAIDSKLAQYRFVHFATHGLLDSEHPEFSGLVLSLVDRQGNKQEGFLGLQDIYNLNLPADLVVLSACETGLGKEISGEGLVGLTRGFMYAGASRVMASLWKVDDVATAELMGRFYRAVEREHMRPAAALQKAQIEMLKQKRWSDPYYWAAFELQGEWK